MVHAGCFCCWQSPIKDMNVRIFWLHVMECMCTQTRPRFILSSEGVLGRGVRIHVNSKGKIPSTGGSEEVWTCDTASCRTACPTHYPLSYSSPSFTTDKTRTMMSSAIQKTKMSIWVSEQLIVSYLRNFRTFPWINMNCCLVSLPNGKHIVSPSSSPPSSSIYYCHGHHQQLLFCLLLRPPAKTLGFSALVRLLLAWTSSNVITISHCHLVIQVCMRLFFFFLPFCIRNAQNRLPCTLPLVFVAPETAWHQLHIFTHYQPCSNHCTTTKSRSGQGQHARVLYSSSTGCLACFIHECMLWNCPSSSQRKSEH